MIPRPLLSFLSRRQVARSHVGSSVRRAVQRLGLWLSSAALGAGGCSDPVQQEQVAALGPEAPEVPPGPLHRAGQPCLICHGAGGDAPRFTAAGTVISTPELRQPAFGVQVRLIDAARRSYLAYTNCIGNFFIFPQEYEPVLPLWVSLSGYGAHIDMESPMHKDGDCGFCHGREKNPSSAGPIFLTEDPAQAAKIPPSSCGRTAP